jgi:hypothetical protein
VVLTSGDIIHIVTKKGAKKMGRKVYSYKHTLTIAEQMLKQAQNSENIEWHNSISMIIFCAFSLEGFLNHVGDELIKDWSSLFENLNPKAKLILLSDKFDAKIDFSKAPFQSFKIIFEIRNQVAHPKTKHHTKSKYKLKVDENRKWDADNWEVYAI